MRVIYSSKDITDYIVSISWSGSQTQVSRKLELQVVNAPNDPNITTLNIKLAEKVYLFNDDMSTEYFRGFVVNRERSSKSGTITITAYDLAFYLLKSSATYNFSSKTAEQITKVVCEDLSIPIGSLASTNHKQKLIVKDCEVYNIIMKAYTQAHEVNDKYYMIRCSKGKLSVVEFGATICTKTLTEDANIYQATYKESLEDMVNRVKIYDGDGKQTGVVSKSTWVSKYGVFQQTYTEEDGKDSKTTAKSMFQGVTKTASVNAIGFMQAITGNGIVIQDAATGLKGLFWITADTHKWTKGTHTMTLSLSFKKSMDEQEV